MKQIIDLRTLISNKALKAVFDTTLAKRIYKKKRSLRNTNKSREIQWNDKLRNCIDNCNFKNQSKAE